MFSPLVPISPAHAPYAFVRRGLPLAVAACFAMPAFANPGGASVAAGQATFSVNGQTLTVTNSPGAIINWQQFSIRPDEITRFVQTNAASAVLNRVTGAQSSQLLGQLLSNGRVFLINPNGVTIGAGAMIDTAGFVASSLNISDADFLSGRMKFAAGANAGKVENFGTIRSNGGPVYLIAPTVENNGVIRADNGDILLAAGKRVEIVAGASPHLRVEIDNPEGAEALNVGQLVGRSVSLYGAAVRNAGTIQATQAEVGAGGSIILRAARDATLDAGSRVTASGATGGTVSVEAGGTLLVDGVVDARGTAGKGGEVQLLGDRVGLLRNAAVDASGRSGGGTVLVGGDYQGANAAVRNAARTYVDAGASVAADAVDSGDGGRVIVWADDTTHFAGTLSARGGAQGGNGGFAEISGKNSLVQRGRVDLTAARGATGTLLLDPLDIEIRGGTADGSDTPDVSTTTLNQSALGQVLFAATGTADPFVVFESELENTAANIILQARNSITVSNAVAFGGGAVLIGNNRNLTLQTRNQAGDGAGGIDLTAGGALSALNFRTQGTGTITIQSGVGPGAVAAPVTLGTLQTANQAVNVSASGNVTLTSNIAAGTGAVSIASTGGSITRTAGTITGGNVTLDSATGVGAAGARVFTAATTLAARSTTSGGVFVDELNAVTVNTIGGLANGTAANGDYDLQAGGSITVSGAINTNGTGNTSVRALPAGANVAIGANIGNTTNTLTTVYAGAAITRTAGTVSGQGVVLDGGTGVGVTAAANRIFTAAGTLAARTRLANGSIFVTEADALTLDTIGGVANGTANGNGGYTLGAGGGITVLGAVATGDNIGAGSGARASGGISLTATTGSIAVNNTLTTGAVATDDAAGNTTATSGAIVLAAGAGGVSGGGALTTGNAELRAAAAAGTDSATSGAITVTAGSGGISLGALTTGTATRSGAGVNTDSAVSGTVTLNAPGAGGGAVTLGGAVNTGAVSNAAANTSGNVALTSGGANVIVNAAIATGNAAASDVAANQTARSGNVTLSGVGAAINAAIGTGNADLGGAAGAGTDSAISGLIQITGGTGGVTASGPLSTGTATRSGAGANTDTTTSGNVTVTTTGATGGAVAIGGAVNTGNVSGGGAGTNASGNVAVTSGGNAITLNGSLATGSAAAADAGANEIARSGTVTLTAATSVTGVGSATTGSATLAGAAGAGTDSAASGGITITAGSGGASGAIALGGVLTTGNAARTDAAQDTVTSGTITLTSRDGIAGAAAPTSLAVLIGTPTGGAANNRGVVRSITSQAGGSIYVTSAAPLVVGDTDTAAGSAQTVSFATTGGADLTVVNNGETLAGDNVLLNSGTGTLTISDTAYNVGAGSLTLTGDEINLTGGANSIRGTGMVTLQPFTATQGINVGGADSGLPTRLDLIAADILALQNGFADIVIGAATGTGQIDVRATTFNDNLTLRTPGTGSGGITVSGALNALTNNVTLASAGPVTQTAAITANGLALTGGGAYTLTNAANNVATLAADAASVAYTDANALSVGTVGTTNGITTGGGAVQLTGAGANPLTVNQAIASNGGTVTLTSGATGSVALNADVASGGGNVAVNGGTGGLAQSAASTVNAGGGTITVDANDGAINFAGTLSSSSASAAAVALRDAAAATLGNIVAPNGTIVLGQAGPDNLSGNVVQTAGTSLAGGALSAVGGAAVTLGNANDFTGSASVSSVGNAVINDVNALTLGPSTVGGTLLATAGGNLTLGGNVTASGAGDAVVLVAGTGAAFLNPGASTITTPAGRWLVYSADPAANVFGGLASGQQALWNRSHPAAVAETGNRYVFSAQPTVTVTSTDVTKTYGTDATAAVAAAFTTAGFVDASLYGNVFIQDTAANALTGGVTSAGSAATASVAGSPYATVVSYTATTGYAVATSAAGRVFVDGAPLTVTANDATKVYGDTATLAGNAFTSSALQNGETIGSVTLTSPGAAATAGVAGSPYAITPSAATGGTFDPNNYVITYVDGALTVTPRPLAVAGDNQTKVYGTSDPALTWTAPGLVNGDTLSGALTRVAGETVPGGPYAITQGTLANPNYAITYTNGALTITPAALLIAANNASRLYGDANPAFTATFTGLANGDTAAAISGLAITTPATVASNVGTYAITPLGGVNPNYSITYADGALAVTPAPLVITANDAARIFGQPNPPFSASFSGFRLGQSLANLTGTLDLSSPAIETSLPGIYPIIPSGVSSLNYAVTFVNGELLVGQAAPPAANARDAALTRSETVMTVQGVAGGCAAPLTPGLVNLAMAPGLCIERPRVR